MLWILTDNDIGIDKKCHDVYRIMIMIFKIHKISHNKNNDDDNNSNIIKNNYRIIKSKQRNNNINKILKECKPTTKNLDHLMIRK